MGSLPDFPLTDRMLCDMIAPYLQLVSSGTWIAATDRDVVRRPADQKVVATGIDLPSPLTAFGRGRKKVEHLGQERLHVVPVVLTRVPVGERAAVEDEVHGRRLACLEPHLGEGLEFLGRPRQARRGGGNVALDDLGSGAGARVGDRHRDGERLTGPVGVRRQRRLADLERRVAQAVAEREPRRDRAVLDSRGSP